MKSVLVLGAGATRAEGERQAQPRRALPPLDRGFFASMQNLDGDDQDLRSIREYLTATLGIDILTPRWDSMELVLSIVVSDCQQLPTKSPAASAIRALYSLLRVYQRALSMTTQTLAAQRKSYIYCWLDSRHHDDEPTVITFNHDLLCESAAHFWDTMHDVHGQRPLLSIPESYGQPISTYNRVSPGREQRFRTGITDPRLRIFKLHGSLNWRSDVSVPAKYREMIGANPKQIRSTTRRSFPEDLHVTVAKVRTPTLPVIIPPLRNKAGVMPRGLHRLWLDARAALRLADEIVFFGYSCPSADTEAENLFRRALGTGEWHGAAVVVNPDVSCVARFADFFPGHPLRYFRTADEWLSS